MIDLNFPLQIAGGYAAKFLCPVTSIPLDQIAQQNDGDIRLLVQVLNGSSTTATAAVTALNVASLAYDTSVALVETRTTELANAEIAAADAEDAAKAAAIVYAGAPTIANYNTLEASFVSVENAKSAVATAQSLLAVATSDQAAASLVLTSAQADADAAALPVQVDVSAASSITIAVEKPDLTTFSRAASLATNGKDGKFIIALDPADLDQAGFYRVQGSFVIASAQKSTVEGVFKVGANIEVPLI